MKQHLPLVIEKTLIVKYKTDTGIVSIPLSEVPEYLKIEIQIMDNIRQKVANNYHKLNESELTLSAQNTRVQQLLHQTYLAEESDNSKSNK